MPNYSTVIEGTVPSPRAISKLIEALEASKNLALVVGSDVDRQGGFNDAVTLAEKLGAQVWEAPYSSRASFPEDHPQFAGFLPALPEQLSKKLSEYDVVLVIGAPVFTLHVAGEMPIFISDTEIYQLTDDPKYAAFSSSTTTVLGSVKYGLEALLERLESGNFVKNTVFSKPIRKAVPQPVGQTPIPVEYAIDQLSRARPFDSIIVEEAPSHRSIIQQFLPITKANSFFTMSSGGLGYALPASVGVALATQKRVICVIGDGSSMYSFQAVWTAVQLNLPVTFVILNNNGYGAMHSFSRILKSESVPGLDLPDINFVDLAKGLGCPASRVSSHKELPKEIDKALDISGSYLLEIAVDSKASRI